MTHALTLALIYALALEAVHLVHAAAAGLAAERRLALEPWPLVAAAVALVIGLVLATDRLTAGLASGHPGASRLAIGLGWLAAALALSAALWLHEQGRAGRRWRAMAANAPGLIAAGLSIGAWPPALLGLGLAALAGWLAPPPTTVDWLIFAGLAVLVSGEPARPRGWAVRSVLLAWLVGGLIGGLETVLDPLVHLQAVALVGLLAARLAAGRTRRPAV